MATLVLENGQLITPQEELSGSISIDGSTIASVGKASNPPSAETVTIDCRDCYVTPGLFDLQVNGGPECNFWADPTLDEVKALRKNQVKHGVTSFLPTLITDDLEHLKKNQMFLQSQGVDKANPLSTGLLARMPGIHLEGPCLSPKRPGVHPPEYLQSLSPELLKGFVGDQVALITLAPELDPSGKAIAYLQEHGVAVSFGHSNATLAEANAAFASGVRLMTHTFNALPPLHHRHPGAVGAALIDDRVTCCMICDGFHLDPAAAALVFKCKGVDKTILVTDAAHVGTSQGGLVGSSITLDEAVRNVVKWQVATFAQAIKMASYNPALACGQADKIGQLSPGKKADIVVWDKNLTIKHVILDGQPVF